MLKMITVVALLLLACDNTPPYETSQKLTLPDATLQESIQTKVDSVFTIPLRCSAGSGYSWQFTDSSFLQSIRYLKQDYKNLSDKDGSEGIQTLYFKAAHKGHETIKLVYVRPFQKPWPVEAPSKTFSINIQ